jgi:iron complex transport system ATP-binding protein
VKLCINDLTFGYNNSKPVLDGVCLEIQPEQVTALIGPNAAGKSTLLKCISGMLRGNGNVWVDGRDLKTLPIQMLTRKIGYLPQEIPSDASLTVFEAVLLGRVHSLNWRVRDEDLVPTMETLVALGIDHLVDRFLRELSGGQRQMVSIGQALVRRPEILVMDEPTNSLDIQHQLELFELIRSITEDNRMTTIVASHDLNLAARFADKVILIHQGKIRAAGGAAEVITDEMLKHVYGIQARVLMDDEGIPQIIPLRSARKKKSV